MRRIVSGLVVQSPYYPSLMYLRLTLEGGNFLLSPEPLTLFTSGKLTSFICFNYNKNCKSVVGLARKSSSVRLSDLSLFWIPVKFKSKLCKVSSIGSFNE